MMTRSPDILFMAEYIKNVLYFATVRQGKTLKNTDDTHYFCIDTELVYENYYSDFGPLNLGCVYKYCRILNEKLKQYLNKKTIVHYTSIDPKKKANSAFLLGCYGVLYLSLSPRDALKPLMVHGQSYRAFQDATQGDSEYTISLMDCLQAINKAQQLGFFNFQDFNYEEYDRLDKIQGGDLNWIVPGKFLAFIGPVDYSVSLYHPPEMYIDYFLENNVKIVIRLNKKLYDGTVFTNVGIIHYDLFFPDGSCPPRHILFKFLQISEEADCAIAVHCKAGLGRTGSLIGCYLIKHYRMTSHEAIGWMRICRPGSVIGHQQGWLEHLEPWLLKQGNLYRKRTYQDIDKLPLHEYGVYSIAEKSMRLRPVVFHKTPSPPAPPPLQPQKQTRSDLMASSRPHNSRLKEALNKATEKECDWRLNMQNATQKVSYRGDTYETNNISSNISRRSSGAGDPKAGRPGSRASSTRSPPTPRESFKSNIREPDLKPLRGYPPITTYRTSQAPMIKNVNDAKNFLMRSSIYNSEREKHLNPSLMVTPHYSTRSQNQPYITSTQNSGSHVTPSTYGSAPKVPIQSQYRRRLGRSPSPPARNTMTEQSRATNTPSPTEKFLTKDASKSALKDVLSRLKFSMCRDGSLGAASLGATRDAPVPRRAPSVRSDERPLATQGDMLNSIKFQRRLRDTITGDKTTAVFHEKVSLMKKPSNKNIGQGTRSNSPTKPNASQDLGTSRDKSGNITRSLFSPTRPMSPKGRRNPQTTSFY